MRETNTGTIPIQTAVSKAPFFLAALLMFLICIKGGRFGFVGEHTLYLPWLKTSHPSFMLHGGKFILLFSITWVLCLIMLLTWPRGLSRSKSWILILIIALFCRMALLPHEPSDDINRYLWEGWSPCSTCSTTLDRPGWRWNWSMVRACAGNWRGRGRPRSSRS